MRGAVSLGFWLVYVPLVKLLSFILYPAKPVRQRIEFERKNRRDPLSRSFREEGTVADLCFEFSSEGEYQQSASLVTDALLAGKRVELVFFSPSVEKGIEELGAKYPRQLRYLRYPFLDLTGARSFRRWVSSKTLVMVRYDFFPELLLWSLRAGNSLHLIWVSFKKERTKNRGPSTYKRLFLGAAQKIIYASSEDARLGERLGHPGETYDFRIEQIRRRLLRKEENFQRNLPQYPALRDLFSTYPRSKRLLFGNIWPSDLFLLQGLPEDFLILVIPHKLSEDVLRRVRATLGQRRGSFVEVGAEATVLAPDPTILVNKKGVLCELYSDFGFAYVGGGFETSIHSVLEPLVSGSDRIACGPKHFRSTEFDLAREHRAMTEVNTPEAFGHWLMAPEPGASSREKLEEVFRRYPSFRDKIVPC